MAVTQRIQIDPMRLYDVAAVQVIERLSFSTPWPTYAFEQELTTNRMAHYVVARLGGRVVGFAGIWLMVDEAHITTFGVHPDWRRRGIGRRILVELFEIASRIGAIRMTLEVRASNEAAQQLYRGFGFEVTGRRIAYYTDDGEDAYVMTTPELSGARMRAAVDAARTLLGSDGAEA
jgi:[ribosomal protein S18]-alanine N-acetyltransferase